MNAINRSLTLLLFFLVGALSITSAHAGFFGDFGDAPLPYPTLYADDGARHFIPGAAAPLILGTAIDGENDGLPSQNADGDDTNGVPDDEDGVTFTSALLRCQDATVDVVLSNRETAFLNAWIDFNANGDWADAGEHVFDDVVVALGSNSFTFPVPCAAVDGATTYARFRVTEEPEVSYVGQQNAGEVEDYRIVLGVLSANIPTLPAFGMVLFAALMGIASVLWLRRRGGRSGL